MIFLPVLLFCAGIVTCVYSNAIPAGNYEENLCPPADDIAPCTCIKDSFSGRLTAWCANFTDGYAIKAIFDKYPNWYFENLQIENSEMKFLPKLIIEEPHFNRLMVASTFLTTLFDEPPVLKHSSPNLGIYLTDVKIQRGLDWKYIANLKLTTLLFKNMRIKSFGREFKDNIPKGVVNLSFQNTGVTSIKYQAFSELAQLQMLTLKGGRLKKVSRDMFPKPSTLLILDLSNQKIEDLPENFFEDMPILLRFYFKNNLLTTISEKVFTIRKISYVLIGNPIECKCNIKWITEKVNSRKLLGECAEPGSLKGTKLSTLTADDFAYCH